MRTLLIVGGGPNVWAGTRREPRRQQHQTRKLEHTRNKHYLNEGFMETYHLKWMREKENREADQTSGPRLRDPALSSNVKARSPKSGFQLPVKTDILR